MDARRAGFLALPLLAVLCRGSFGEPAPAGPDASRDRVARLVKDLGADDATTRDRATKDLERIGEPATPALREAAKSDDPEVAWRARTLLDHIDAARPERESENGPAGGTQVRPPAPGKSGATRLHSFNFRFDPGASNSSVIITQDGSGRVSVSVTEEANGRKTAKTYEAESAEDFKRKYPDVARKYGIGEAGRAPRVLGDFVPRGGLGRLWDDFGLDEDFFDRDWPQGFGDEMDRLHDQVRRQMDDLFRRHHLDAWGDRFMQKFRKGSRDKDPAEGPAPKDDEGAQAPDAPPAPPPAGPPAPPGTLGIRLGEVPAALRDQLKLGDEDGVVVEEVLPASRAERAGFKAHDVVLTVNGIPVRGVWELRRVLREEQSKGAGVALEFAIVRGGEKRTLKAPAE